MFGWRRRSEGFEWREYVRTTILVRRADRQRRIDDAREAALNKVKHARDKGVAAGQAGYRTVMQTARDVLFAALGAVWGALRSGAATTWQILCAIGREIRDRVPGLPVLPKVSMPRVSMPRVALPKISLPKVHLPRVGLADVAEAGMRAARPKARETGAEAEDDAPLRPDVAPGLPFNPRILGGAALAVLIVIFVGPMLRTESNFSAPQLVPTSNAPPSETSALSDPAGGAPHEVSGTARAIRGDLLRVGGKLVKLASVESPSASHPCTRRNGTRWNCSAAAHVALRRLVAGNKVTCVPTGETENGHLIGRCAIDGRDIGDEMVRKGHVFAAQGFFATYSASESEAQANKVGVWQGNTLRPEEWRSQVWEEAKLARPDGCPIKGFVRSSTYAMPWSRGYDRKIREQRGDRWFCSEEEARSAGFNLAGSL